MSHRIQALAVVLVTVSLAGGCAGAVQDQRVSEAPPPAVPAPGALIGPPTGWRTLTEGQAPVPIPGHPPVTTSGVVASFDRGTGILRFEDGRMVRLTGQSKVVQPAANAVRIGDLVVLQDVLPVGVQSGVKTLAVGKPQRMGTIASVDESRGLVQLTDGTTVRVTGTTNVHQGAAGSSIALGQLSPGDELVIVLGDGGAASPAPQASDDATVSPSALPRQDVSPRAVEADEVMIFRAPRRP
jgi:hypothetical protein